ncbi:MAG: hypothetical protein A2939_00145 [Parcubacteria group bacterium RIFCSPLOWO2_01_FULL_48_18]|nr:MAG: hypothetical protein A3J67_05900 [Parcubacteria group bacterium RIFCSPHIGHO2_02_FULL_48_10b]OHB22176.1 MAG: hypothetical protein A2939_00145 [Parcubacteria group bacterium RIFCSPLOWO2_01_FULL_48_18]
MNSKPLVLIVDDEPEMLDIYGTVLRQAGFDVVLARDGQEGIGVAKKTHPDLILMDIKMPVLDGMDATMKLKSDEATRDIKVVFLTAFGDPEVDKKVAHAYGAIDFVKKGATSLDEFARLVGGYIAKGDVGNAPTPS